MDSQVICQTQCKGNNDYGGDCCCVIDGWILGPVHDVDDFLERLRLRYGRLFLTREIFYEFEEGAQLFPDRERWQREEAYPALRINVHHPKNACMFFSSVKRGCSVYDIRPGICQSYECDYLKQKRNEEDENVHSCEQRPDEESEDTPSLAMPWRSHYGF